MLAFIFCNGNYICILSNIMAREKGKVVVIEEATCHKRTGGKKKAAVFKENGEGSGTKKKRPTTLGSRDRHRHLVEDMHCGQQPSGL